MSELFDPDHPFFVAVRDVDVPAIRELLDKSPEVANASVVGDWSLTGTVWRDGQRVAALAGDCTASAIHFAAFHGHAELASVLIEFGADVNRRTLDDNKGATTPLVLGAWEGSARTVLLLLQAGADANASGLNQSALHTAIVHRAFTKANMLLQFGAKHDIHTAAMMGDLRTIKSLVHEDADCIRFADSDHGKSVLRSAARFGQHVVARFLIEHGAETSPPIDAALGNVVAIRQLIADDPESVSALYGTQPLLLWAIDGTRLRMVEVLLELGADPVAGDQWGVIPLRAVANSRGDDAAQIVDRLVQAGANVNQESRGYTPLAAAAERGNIPVIRALLQHDANVNLVCCGEQTPLHFAPHNEHVASAAESVTLLLRAGADADLRDDNGKTPLDVANKYGCGEVSRLLSSPAVTRLDDEAYVFVRCFLDGDLDGATEWLQHREYVTSYNGLTAHPLLLTAVRDNRGHCYKTGQLAIAEMLLPASVREFRDAIVTGDVASVRTQLRNERDLIHAQFTSGPVGAGIPRGPQRGLCFPIHYATTEVTEILLKAGADVNALNTVHSIGETVLNLAIRDGDVGRVRFLLEHSARPNVGLTKFMPSSSMDEIIDLLLQHGWDINECPGGRTLIHHDASHGHGTKVRTLLRYGADPNVRDSRGQTPLHLIAARGTGTETIKQLIAAGADLAAVDSNGNSPLDLAMAAKSQTATRTLVQLKAEA